MALIVALNGSNFVGLSGAALTSTSLAYLGGGAIAVGDHVQISITYKLKLNGGDMKSVQGDSGQAQVKMVADVYSHIIDDDRRLHVERLEAAFYSGRTATPEPAQLVPEAAQDGDAALLMRLLQNPEMSALLKTLAKNL